MRPGWVDFDNHCSQVCPDGATVDEKYENCLKCRNRTGFNPAFYHADSVSAQQEKINQQPHFVYLAYFAPGVIKVGISQEERGIRRLLEQGARLAVKLETFASALIARQYEAKIAGLSYSWLGSVHVKKGDYVVCGDTVGTAGKNAAGSPSLIFMVFQNGMPIDPAKAPRG